MENRRSKLTRKLFRQALKEELKSNKLSELSVRRICQQADMNRSTFYLHYHNIQDLLEETIDVFISHYPLENQYGVVEREDIIRSIHFIKENKIVFCKFVQSGILLERLITQLKRNFNNQQFWPHHTTVNLNRFIALTHYVIAGSNALLIYWLDNESDISIDELAEMLIRLQAAAREQFTQ